MSLLTGILLLLVQATQRAQFTAPKDALAEAEREGEHVDPMEAHRSDPKP